MPRKGSRPWYWTVRNMWYVTIEGHQIALNVRDSANETEAGKALEALLSAAKEKGVKPWAIRGPTVSEAVTHYLTQIRGRVVPNTYRVYAWCLSELSAAIGPHRPVASLSARQVEKTVKAKWSSSTANDYLGSVGTFLRAAGHPLPLKRPPKESRGAEAVWTDQEFWQVYGAANGDYKPVLLVLKDTGCRPSEACALTVENVDWENALAVLKKHKTAGKGKARVIHFPAPLLDVLREQKRQYERGHLFLNSEWRPFTGDSLSREFIRIRARAKVRDDLTLYGLRHWYCCRALATGASNEMVAALVGNSAPMIERHYGHLDANARLMRELAEKVSKAG